MRELTVKSKRRNLKLVALVDDDDFDLVSRYNWTPIIKNRSMYLITGINYKTVYMHRLIMGVTDRYNVIDHIDHNSLNNQKSNLRVCSQAENVRNHRKRLNATSKFIGVSKSSRSLKSGGITIRWDAFIRVNKKGNKRLGVFSYEIDAAKAYDRAAKESFGEFAKLNFKE